MELVPPPDHASPLPSARALAGIKTLDRLAGDDETPGLWAGESLVVENDGESGISTEALFAQIATAYATHPAATGTLIVVDTNALLGELVATGIVPRFTHRLAEGVVALVCLAAGPNWRTGCDTFVYHAAQDDMRHKARLVAISGQVLRKPSPNGGDVPSVIVAPGTLREDALTILRGMTRHPDSAGCALVTVRAVPERDPMGHVDDACLRHTEGCLLTLWHRRAESGKFGGVDFRPVTPAG